MAQLFIGTAGWSIAARHAGAFPGESSQLERYAGRLDAVEINSSFYRPHKHETYERWAGAVPPGFRFSVKLPRLITHERRLAGCAEALDAFLGQVAGLGRKLGVLLVQLPPSLRYVPDVAGPFLRLLRERTGVRLACEPRHPSWFGPEAGELFERLDIARVAADPVPRGCIEGPGGWPGLVYHRLHGSPRIYYSDYPAGYLEALAGRLAAETASGADIWCVFDNTAQGHALDNALATDAMVREKRPETGRRPGDDPFLSGRN
jgi:uncharacterized protein YecE (DUF72 family)